MQYEVARRIVAGPGDMSLLAFFKYFNFFTENLHHLLTGLGFHPEFSALQVILPVGISFSGQVAATRRPLAVTFSWGLILVAVLMLGAVIETSSISGSRSSSR